MKIQLQHIIENSIAGIILTILATIYSALVQSLKKLPLDDNLTDIYRLLIFTVIGTVIAGIILLPKNYKISHIIFSVTISTIMFIFGNILQPAVQYLIEGGGILFDLNAILRKNIPWLYFLILFLCGFFPGLLTGLSVLNAKTLKQRIIYGTLSAVIFLTIFDVVTFVFAFRSDSLLLIEQIDMWGFIWFSLISDIVGGAFGGLVIGGILHAFVTWNLNETDNINQNNKFISK